MLRGPWLARVSMTPQLHTNILYQFNAHHNLTVHTCVLADSDKETCKLGERVEMPNTLQFKPLHYPI